MKNIVKLYLLDTKQVENNLDFVLSTLSKEQFEKAKKYKRQKDYLLSLAGSFLVNKFTPNTTIYYGEHGKPCKEGVEYNIAHSDGFAVIAVSQKPVGVDIEKVRKYNPKILIRIFSQQEIEKIKNPQDYFAIWTLKESLLKCTGIGLYKHTADIPALPEKKKFENETYFSKTIFFEQYVVSVTQQTNINFETTTEFVKI